MSRWSDSATWVGEDLRREAFFFPSQGVQLYGSLYAHASAQPAFGVLICNSWGYEANLASRIVHAVSVEAAKAGGLAMNFHYPGFGDSQGDFAALTMDGMAEAAATAMQEAMVRWRPERWILAGLMLGASVAAIAGDRGPTPDHLLLVQPALRPGAYFTRLERASKRSLGGPAPAPAQGFAYGYPLRSPMLDSVAGADAAVEAALDRFGGEGTVVRHEKPTSIEGVPGRFDQVRVAGVWRFGSRDNWELARAAADWLKTGSGAAV